MRLHRFYSPVTIAKNTAHTIISTELVHQLKRVFRFKTGDNIVLFDGSGFDYTCAIVSYTGDDRVDLDVRSSAPSRFTASANGRRLWLFTALVKKDNFETIVEKATELGVTDIVAVLAERSEKKNTNEVRLAKIVTEASEQSGRGDLPVLHPVMSLNEALDVCVSKKLNMPIVFHTDGAQFGARPEKGTDRAAASTEALFIGPEGGWSPRELEMFHTNKIAIRCLGPQVLRAETAVVAALSCVVFR